LYPSSELPATACKDAPMSNATRDWSGGPRACVLVTRSEENANEEKGEEEERDIIVTVLLPLSSFPTTDGVTYNQYIKNETPITQSIMQQLIVKHTDTNYTYDTFAKSSGRRKFGEREREFVKCNLGI